MGRGWGWGENSREGCAAHPHPYPLPTSGRGTRRRERRGCVQRGEREFLSSHAPCCRLGWTILPSLATSVPLTISSSQLTFKAFSFLSIKVSRKAKRFLA